jgi:ankyrin repeat protein
VFVFLFEIRINSEDEKSKRKKERNEIKMSQKYFLELNNGLGEMFYQSCSYGNVRSVRELLPLLSYDQVNFIYPITDQTSLHAASIKNHHEIVRLLLENNLCNRILRNKQNENAYESSNFPSIRSLFDRDRQEEHIDRFVSHI